MDQQNVEISDWAVIEHGWHPDGNRFYESLFSLGNGHMGLRGFFEEKYTGDTLRGAYTAGIFYPDRTRVGWWKNGYPEFFAKVLNTTNWAGIGIEINGQEIDLHRPDCSPQAFTRALDLRRAVYSRRFTLCDSEGNRTSFVFTRFLSMAEKHLACISVEITPLDRDSTTVLTPYLDGNVVNEDANYDEVFCNRISEGEKPYPFVTTETQKTRFRQTCAMSCRCYRGGAEIAVSNSAARSKYVETSFHLALRKGETGRLVKLVSVCTSRNFQPESVEENCLKELQDAACGGEKAMLEKHCRAMEALWRRCDIEIEGDSAAQQGIRYNILELMLTYSGDDERLNIGPKGFTGEKYGGGTYWDTEAFCLPFYLLTAPSVARNLLLYRYRHLPMAIENARKLGLQGALYPMVTMDGRECHNEWEITFEEIHRNGAIAYAIYNYVRFTGDTVYLRDYGTEVLVELCRFWASRVTYCRRKNCYMILGVTGPNEYENNVNNNYYTNTMAAWTLRYTLQCLETFLPKNAPGSKEMKFWSDIAAKMYYPIDAGTGVFEQNDGYMDKELVPASAIPKNERPICQQWSWDKILRSCYIKQADVLQAFYFFPRQYSIEEQNRNFAFYEPMTVHESSLSPSIHSIVASRIGAPEKAYELYLRAARLDLENRNNDTADGLHVTSMGASWAAVIQGFAGVDLEGDALTITPHLPKMWNSLRFHLDFRGAWLCIDIEQGHVQVHAENRAINCCPNGEGVLVTLRDDPAKEAVDY